MYTVTAQFLAAIRGPHKQYGYVEAWRAGTQLTFDDGSGHQTPHLPLYTAGRNEITVDSSTPGVRRTLTVTLAPQPGLWDTLAPQGTELHPYTVMEYLGGATETVPQGVFDIDVQARGYSDARVGGGSGGAASRAGGQVGGGSGGGLVLTCPDRWNRIQNSRFLAPRQFGGGLIRTLIGTLLLEALPAGSSVTDRGTSTATVPSQTVDRDRDKFLQELAAAASVDVFFDRTGQPFIRDAPILSATPIWTTDAGATGVLLDASRERNRQKTYNMVVVHCVNGVSLFDPVVVWDNDPSSPTFAGPGPGYGPLTAAPASTTAGPFGQRPTFYSSPLVTTDTQAVTAGRTILERVRGQAAQLTLMQVPNLALDDGDTISVRLPQERDDIPRPVEAHIIDKLTVPLVPSRYGQSLETRSTRTDSPSDT
jgi:hypothetical protein